MRRLAAVASAALTLCLPAVASENAAPTLDEVWANPPPEARTRAYWWWLNGNVDRAAITRDLEQMKAKGFGGAVIIDAGGADQDGNHPVPHGPTFGTPAWIDLLRHALAEADRLGLEMSLNMQSGWNLGGPTVTNDDAVKKLVWSETTVEGPAPVDVALPAPPRVGGYYRDWLVVAYPIHPDRPPSGGVADWPSKTLEAKLPFTGPHAFFLANSAPQTGLLVREEKDHPGEEDARSAGVVDLTSYVTAGGRLRWQPPAGRWQILRFGCTLGDVHEVSTASDGWHGNALDVFDRGAFERYANTVLVPILERVRPYLGRSLRYLHTDSWEIDLTNWTPTIRDEFRRRRGYDLLPFLPAFAGRIVNSRTTTDRFLNDYRKTLGDLAVDNHYRPYQAFAAQYGLLIHPESGGPHYTPIDAQRCLGLDDVPMSEFWARSKTHRTTDESRFFVKQPASAAHTYGHPLVSAEGFTSIGPHWQETLWDNLKPSFDYAIGEGLNRLVWHAFVCSPASMGVPGQQYFAGTHFNPNVTWWNDAGPFLMYLNRCQAMMQRGRFVADALYYYGDHVPNFAQLRASDPAGLGPGYDYDAITEETLVRDLRVDGGRLVLPDGMRYRVLVLAPERTIDLPVLRQVRSLVAEGAVVIGERPDAASSLTGQPEADAQVRAIAGALWSGGGDAALPSDKGGTGPAGRGRAPGRVISDRTARDVLAAEGVPPDVTFASAAPKAAFDSMHRREGDTDIYFIASRSDAPVEVDVGFRVVGRAPEVWDPVTGGQRFAPAYRMGRKTTTVPLTLPPYGSRFVIFRAPASAHPATAASNETVMSPVGDVRGPWQVTFDRKWGGPGTVAFDSLVSWTMRPEPGIRFYSGTATYRRAFDVSAGDAGARLWLDLGAVRELAAVRVNGMPVGIVWAPPFRVDISPAVRVGENQLEIDVVNFWPNRIIGDASLPAERRFTRTNIAKLTARSPLMPSGLFGPVRVLREER
ncbi:MAG TPA: glycosyl hydrolase [Opitutaceae bacterium]|nr:glycosyl hydrolase [Opitutaceae bacterium]